MEFLTFRDVFRPDYERVAGEIRRLGYRRVATCAWGSGNEEMLWKILREGPGGSLVITDGRPLTMNMHRQFGISSCQARKEPELLPECLIQLCNTAREPDRWPISPGFHRALTLSWLILYVPET